MHTLLKTLLYVLFAPCTLSTIYTIHIPYTYILVSGTQIHLKFFYLCVFFLDYCRKWNVIRKFIIFSPFYQVKLFHDWYGNWAESEKSRLLEQLRAADPDFMAQYDKQISSSSSGAQEESPAPVETMEEGHNPPSSVSSPPSTLPRSHSPHDSGLDEPPSDSDHTEPHSLDSSHEPEDQRTANSQVALESVTAPTPPMKSCISTAENTACQKPEALANGCSDVINSAPSEQVLTTASIEEGQVEQ